jgi:adenosylcobinamide-GDP ribazoletransferase
VRFLTCVPLPAGLEPGERGLERALPYFPLVGLAIGSLLTAIDHALSSRLAQPLLDFCLLALLLVVSGGLHLDGLIDTADALPRSGSAANRLAAMRESWAGQRGAIAAWVELLLVFGALEALPPGRRGLALMLAPMLARWAIVYAYVAFPYARRTAGLSLALKRGAGLSAGLTASLFVLAISGLLSWQIGPSLLGVCWLVSGSIGWVAQRRLGGLSGDVYGAIEQIVEALVLVLCAALWQTAGGE